MKSRDTLIRLKRFQLEEKRRRVRQIELMVAEFTRMIGDLDREIANEEKRAGITDPARVSPEAAVPTTEYPIRVSFDSRSAATICSSSTISTRPFKPGSSPLRPLGAGRAL